MMKRQKSASESNLPSQTVDLHARPNEYELQESAERLDIFINAIPDLVIFKDGQGRYLEANDFTLRLFGLEGWIIRARQIVSWLNSAHFKGRNSSIVWRPRKLPGKRIASAGVTRSISVPMVPPGSSTL
jgi:PAS domain-containing protein